MALKILAFLFIFAASLAEAQTTCNTPLQPLTKLQATQYVHAELPYYATLTNVAVAVFERMADPNVAAPLLLVTVPKAGWMLQANTTNCYSTATLFLASVPQNVVYDLRVKENNGTWSVATPFMREVLEPAPIPPTPIPPSPTTGCLDATVRYPTGTFREWKWSVKVAAAEASKHTLAGWQMTRDRQNSSWSWWHGVCQK